MEAYSLVTDSHCDWHNETLSKSIYRMMETYKMFAAITNPPTSNQRTITKCKEKHGSLIGVESAEKGHGLSSKVSLMCAWTQTETICETYCAIISHSSKSLSL